MSRKTTITLAMLTTAALAVAAFLIYPRVAERQIMVTAQFEDTVGLYEGNAVSVLGMPIGRVASIVPKGSYIEVKLAIDKGIDIPADVEAVTVSTSILTDRHIELTPPYRAGPKLRSGDVLGLGRTRTPVEFDRTLAMVNKLSVALRGDSEGNGPLADLVNIGSQITTGSGPDLKATLDELSQALRLGPDQGAGSRRDIQTIVTNLDELTQSAVDNDATIREFGSNLHQLSDILAAENLGSGATGAKVNQILAQATSLLEKNRDRLKTTATDTHTLTTALVDYQRELSEFFDVAPMTIDNIYNAIDPVAGVFRGHGLADKILVDSQMGKELCNLMGLKQLGCASGTLRDYAPDFGLNTMLQAMAGTQP